MKKYKKIFKDGIFWLIIIILSILEMVRILIINGSLNFPLALGIIIGSFAITFIGYTTIYLISKFLNKLK
jgi:hypothetical protein